MTTIDTNIETYSPLITPNQLFKELPLSNDQQTFINKSRRIIENIITGRDPRLLVIIGPCSIHDTEAAMEYAKKLKSLRKICKDKLYIVMRTYFEKPRSCEGWKGLINDPHLNGSYDINTGFRVARKLLLDIVSLKIPVTCEFLETISAQYISDLVSWGAIGARTTESQIHRQLSSGLSCPIGFKNTCDGSITAAVNGAKFASQPQTFLGINEDGKASIVKTRGNPYCHVVLRGGTNGPNYELSHLEETTSILKKYIEDDKNILTDVTPRFIVDCSHGNSNKSWEEQIRVVNHMASLFAENTIAKKHVCGIMIESFLRDGNQKLESQQILGGYRAKDKLDYGKSITDECIGLKKTKEIIQSLYDLYPMENENENENENEINISASESSFQPSQNSTHE
jgi:3-deoxy-7-phosphoheptulonate synthase